VTSRTSPAGRRCISRSTSQEPNSQLETCISPKEMAKSHSVAPSKWLV
jgi:hypothetical protein